MAIVNNRHRRHSALWWLPGLMLCLVGGLGPGEGFAAEVAQLLAVQDTPAAADTPAVARDAQTPDAAGDQQPAASGDKALAAAQQLLRRGKYAEATEAFTDRLASLTDADPPAVRAAAAIGLSRVHGSQGRRTQAAEVLRQGLQALATVDAQPAQPQLAQPQLAQPRASLHAELAQWHLDQGQYESAEQHASQALAADAEQLLARWVTAELHRLRGQHDEANDAYHWFVKYYNAHEVTSAEQLCLIGKAAAQYARWNRLSDQFSFLVNELYPDALQLEPSCAQAHREAGLLYLEKYNQAEAERQLQAALRLNPSSAETLAALAALGLQKYELEEARRLLDRALAINPELLEAYYLYADSHLANFELTEAIERLEKARALHPLSDEVLGRLAAAWGVRDGLSGPQADKPLGQLVAEVNARNNHAGEFYYALARGLELMRKYPAALEYFRESVERMPRLVGPQGELGMVYMRMGREDEARRTLDKAFETDPFNVRVSNTLKVLEVLDTYATIETDHFLIRFDRGQDEVLARCVARYLEEEVYPELTAQFGFEPQEKSLFEIFSRSRSTSGHGWFSARMVGLPYVGTVGACAGQMVAIVSPNDMPKRYNWARVVKHEFVHVLNLQQSNFNIPHWFTEALAVESEGYPRSREWNEMLARRVPAGKMFDLSTINLAFVRPRSDEDWQMAYCQAQLYAQYMVEKYGADAPARMLTAYAENLDTRSALRRSFDVEQEAFEQGYLEFVGQIVATLPRSSATSPADSLAELTRAHEAAPLDPDIAGKLALAQLARRAYPEARQLAHQTLTLRERDQRALYVLIRLQQVIGDHEAADKLLAGALDEAAPEPNLLRLLAGKRVEAEDYEEAARLYTLGAQHFVGDPQWNKLLAAVYLRAGNTLQLVPMLEQLAQADPDDPLFRKKLAQLASEADDRAAMRRWATAALEADTTDDTMHFMLAEAQRADGQWAQAAESYALALLLKADEPRYHLALAQTLVELGERERARRAVEELLRRWPDHAEGAELLKGLE